MCVATANAPGRYADMGGEKGVQVVHFLCPPLQLRSLSAVRLGIPVGRRSIAHCAGLLSILDAGPLRGLTQGNRRNTIG